jgi:hypothetical protein
MTSPADVQDPEKGREKFFVFLKVSFLRTTQGSAQFS